MLTRKPLSWFKIDKNQPRKSFNDAEDHALGESMQHLGQLQPVGAMADGTLLWGERRYRAAQLVGIGELSVIVTDRVLSDTEIRVIQLSENLHRSSLTDRRGLSGGEGTADAESDLAQKGFRCPSA